MKIAIGCDHGGLRLKGEILTYLQEKTLSILILEPILVIQSITPTFPLVLPKR
jgi:ribose 5-phosphate isomerase RpiB